MVTANAQPSLPVSLLMQSIREAASELLDPKSEAATQ
ncbi:hypothetical protein M728_003640 (plasmid) [Ensifer sp. WSM1721]